MSEPQPLRESRPMLDIGVEPVAPGEVIVVVRGELDCATSGQLRAAITALLEVCLRKCTRAGV